MGLLKYLFGDWSGQGKNRILDLADVTITTLDESTNLPNAVPKSVLSHLQQLSRNSAANLYQGVIDCSGNPNYPAMTPNQYYVVSVIGKIGGGSGIHVEVGDVIYNKTVSAGGTQASVGSSYVVVEKNFYIGLWSELTPATRATTGGQLLADGTRSVIANIANLDASIGVSVVPVVTRTNNPIINTNSTNANITALDNAIGADNTPVARTNNPTVVNTTVQAKVQALDGAIGVTPTSTNIVAAANSVNVNISALDAAVYAIQQNTSGPITATGSVQGDGPIGSLGVVVVSAANGTKAITLPAVATTKYVVLYNIVVNNDLIVFPAANEYINAAAQNASVKFKHATDVSYVLCTYASAGHWTMTALHATIS